VVRVDTPVDRWLTFEGLDNVRDVGGLPLRGGGRTRSGVLLRSAALRAVTPGDVTRLVDDFGLRLVLDLRSPREIERDGPSAVARAGVETVELTFIGASREILPEAGDTTDPVLRNYLGYLSDHPANVAEGVRRLAAEDAGPTLVHCAAGKDRTGVLVAMVLDAVGVEREAVIEDYVLSATQVEAIFRRRAEVLGEPVPDDVDVHKPRAEVMVAVLDHLDEGYAREPGAGGPDGGAAGWLRANGLTDADLERLRAHLTSTV
jgi:protein-tyrosine phosphatase